MFLFRFFPSEAPDQCPFVWGRREGSHEHRENGGGVLTYLI